MGIDICCLVLLVLAIFKGYRQGLIVAVSSVLAFMVGLAAAMKLSAIVVTYLSKNLTIGAQWLPFISFLIVFIAVVWLVRLGAGLLEKTAGLVLLGWANKMAGVVLYTLLYFMLLSVIIFYAAKMNLASPGLIASSKAWPWIKPLGPWAMDGIGKVIPYFKDMFGQLASFFEGVSKKGG